MGYCIVTRYHGPTNYRGSRIIGTGPSLHYGDNRPTRATVSWDYAGGPEESHRAAAEAVAVKLRADGWHVTIADHATLPDESGYVWPLAYDTDR